MSDEDHLYDADDNEPDGPAARPLIPDPIQFLVDQFCESIGLTKGNHSKAKQARLNKEVAEYKERLKALPVHEINALLEKAFPVSDAYILEEALWFMKPVYRADVEKWGAIVSWTIEEATALFILRDPDRFPWDEITSWRHNSKSCKSAYEFNRAITRIAKREGWPRDISAKTILNWAEGSGFQFSAELIRAVKENASNNEANFDEVILSPREYGTLRRMVMAMAIAKYDFNPFLKGSHGSSEISSDIQALGMCLTPPTVTKFLQWAKPAVKREDFDLFKKKKGAGKGSDEASIKKALSADKDH